MSGRILVVEDNVDLAFGLEHALKAAGYDVRVAHDVDAAFRLHESEQIGLMILDLMLPQRDGFAILENLRGRGWTGPVLVLTARSEESDKVAAFTLGADDYVTKPFGIAELLARVAALLRRVAAPVAAVQRFGDVEVDLATRQVRRDGELVALSPRAYELLVALLSRRGAVATRADLLREVWQYSDDIYSRTVDIHMTELRRKLEDVPAEPRHLLTVRKAGYRLALTPEAP